ncbi:MAG: hypothetical protein A3K19_02125 [Lentisphaerae bacterium RIFOXYB12_FULL_65_16]|nr:MAG: hypothetical protein A3K18_25345 [Lentisphaerae bacterium RIFOXYA12_64_32]OGV92595.1 MAG: hypothetical protein A3K19_02125 [Lentisphaerae bacterium RIFOXYB12_FULL_65_16]
MVLALVVAARAAFCQEVAIDAAAQAVLWEKIKPSVVWVQFSLGYDQGQAPVGCPWTTHCPVCGGMHGAETTAAYIHDERPLELLGFVLSTTQVLAPDPLIPARFIRGVTVRQGERGVAAHVVAYARERHAVFLELAAPLDGALPLSFDANRPPPYLYVGGMLKNARRTIAIQPVRQGVTISDRLPPGIPAMLSAAIFDTTGDAVGASMVDSLPVDGSWKGAPLSWPMVSTEELGRLRADLEQRAERGLLRVTLQFRSPAPGDRSRYLVDREDYPTRWGERPDAAEQNELGILVDARRVLVLAGLSRRRTGRLQSILVYPASGEPVPARFEGSLAHYGGVLATLDTPLAGALSLSGDDLAARRFNLLMGVTATVQGESRSFSVHPTRILWLRPGWQGQLYPALLERDNSTFVFDLNGDLLALPLAVRIPVALKRDPGMAPELDEGSRQLTTAAACLRDVLRDPAGHVNPANVPVAESDEERTAWLGVILQPLNPNLAAEHKVFHLTRDGQTGAIVSYVYPDSPAAQAGIKSGDILLRLHVEGQAVPLEVIARDYGGSGGGAFPWDSLDEMNDRGLEHLPAPWPPIQDDLTEALTEIGFGKKVKIELVSDGQAASRDTVITESPPHFESAPRYKSDSLGVTVRDLTFEVRRHLQIAADASGVIVAGIKSASKASVAGIRPYEIITHINGQPVRNVKEFEALAGQGTELRFAVKRLQRERQVKIRVDADPGTGRGGGTGAAPNAP